MRKESVGPSTGRRTLALLVCASILMCLQPRTARGQGIIGATYTLNWDQVVAKTETETTDSRKFKHALDVKYKGFLSPVVRNEVTLKIEHEVDNSVEPPSTVRIFPTINLDYKGSYWNAGAKRTIEDTSVPGENTKIADSYFVEFYHVPTKKELPDLKGKYTLDKDVQAETADTDKQVITLSSVYRPNDWLELKGDYNRNMTADHLRPDSDTEDDKLGGTVGLRHLISRKIKVQTEYRAELSKGATLLDGGGTTNDKEDQTHTWKNTLGFRPFRDTTVDASYDFDLKQNIISGEHTITKNMKVAAAQDLGDVFDVKGDFSRAISDARHTADDNEKIEDTWTGEFRARFSKQLDFSLKYQNKHTGEEHIDPAKDTTSGSRIYTATWAGAMTPFWKASASYDKTDTFTKEVKTTIDTKYSLKSTLDFKAISLTLEPACDITKKQDLVKPEETEIVDFKFKIAYKVLTTRTVEAKFDHTYGRKTDSGAGNIQRTDNSSGNLMWKEPFPGWTFGFDVTRAATDTSEDDVEPDIASSYGFKADYRYDRFTLGTSYKYDAKSLADNSEIFDVKAGWTAPRWNVSLTYSFNKTFSAALNEGYSISVAFQYNL